MLDSWKKSVIKMEKVSAMNDKIKVYMTSLSGTDTAKEKFIE
jgi:hypothetical protein